MSYGFWGRRPAMSGYYGASVRLGYGRRGYGAPGPSIGYAAGDAWSRGAATATRRYQARGPSFSEQIAELTKHGKTQFAARRAEIGDKLTISETPFPDSRVFVPNDGKATHPGIVMLHGSEGGGAGMSELLALELAQRGFVVLTYSYYGSPNTPKTLARIDISETMRALDWLKTSPYVGSQKVGLAGGSRGAEQALLLASVLRDSSLLSAVAAHAPNSKTVGGFDPQTGGRVLTDYGRVAPAWRFRNTDIASDRDIQIEDYAGPVYITHGAQDEIWPAFHTRELERRLNAAGKRAEVHYFEGQGHNLEGEARTTEFAQMVDFFTRALG